MRSPTWSEVIWHSRSNYRHLVVPTANSVNIMSPNPNRIGFSIGNPTASGSFYLVPDEPAITARGFRIGVNAGMSCVMTFSLADYGDIVRHEWNGIAIGSNQTITIIETLIDWDTLNKTLGLPAANYPHM